jgi:translation elongation factor EF-Ts
MAGRIETYIHSDKSVPNKGAAMVRVVSQTDFAARTDQFISFTKDVAKMAFASQAETWDDLIAAYPSLEVDRREVADVIREKVVIDQITLMLV